MAAVTTVASHEGWLGRLENQALDVVGFSRAEAHADQIVLVDIDDRSFNESFHCISPLDRQALGRILEVVCASGPAAVGLDVMLDQPGCSPDQDRALLNRIDALRASGCRILTARASPRERRLRAGEAGEDSNPSTCYHEPTGQTGSIIFPIDLDGRVRRFIPFSRKGEVPGTTFPVFLAYLSSHWTWNAMQDLLGKCGYLPLPVPAPEDSQESSSCEPGPRRPEVRIEPFAQDGFLSVPALHLLDMAPSEVQPGQTVFSERTVLIGGTFEEGSDIVATPWGNRAGLHVLASATASLLPGHWRTPLSLWLEFLLDVLIGLGVGLAFERWSPVRATTTCTLLLAPAAGACSWLVFATTQSWLTFVPTAVGVGLHAASSGILRLRATLKVHAHLAQRVRELEGLLHVPAAELPVPPPADPPEPGGRET